MARFPRLGVKVLTAILVAVLALFLAVWSVFLNRSAPPAPGGDAVSNSAKAPVADLPRAASKTGAATPDLFADIHGALTAEELLALARRVVARSPAQAIAQARAQGDAALRERLLFAVVQAWAELDPRAAVNWALRQDEAARFAHLEAAWNGAIVQPQTALQIVRELIAENPETGAAFGTALIGALSGSGKFAAAIQLANDAPADARAGWLQNIFTRWGASRPMEGLQTLDTLEPSVRDAAFAALTEGWAAGDPSGLAAHAMSLPTGPRRELALNTALANWSLQDPAAMGEWLNAIPASTELDRAVAQLITRTDSVNRSPEVAMTWIETIDDPDLRRQSLRHVMRQWIESDATAAWEFCERAAWINDADREDLRQDLAAANRSPSAAKEE